MKRNIKISLDGPDGVRRPARIIGERISIVRVIVVLTMLAGMQSGHAAEIVLMVQTERAASKAPFLPLAEYLSRSVGEDVRVVVRGNPLAHWRTLVAGERPALVLEDPHFADYRISRSGYRVAAAVDGAQSFSIAVGGFLLLDPIELAGRPVAALSPPSLSTLQFLRFYSDPVRSPRLVEAGSFQDAAARVTDAGAVAAVLPANSLAEYPGLTGAVDLEDLPQQALLVSPDLDEALFEGIVSALLAAGTATDGRRALTAMGVGGFSRSHAEAYEGYSRLLKGTWGFREVSP